MTATLTAAQPRTAATPGPAPLVAGVLGSAAMAIGSWSIAGVPKGWRNELGALPWALFYGGLAAFCAAWIVLGLRLRAVAGEPAGSVVGVRRFVLATAAPLLAAAPMGRDLWAYAAQGRQVARGFDPYVVGPSAVPGAYMNEVSTRWQNSPSPYGPIWLRISQFAVRLAGEQPTVAAVLLRLPAYLGLGLCCWALTVLARRVGVRADVALWLGPACPLMIVLGVGGGHNDLLALGLALAALAVATRPGLTALAAGAALAAVAVLVKSPALIALAFTVPVWLLGDPDRARARRLVTAAGTALASAAVALGLGTALAGLGAGWTTQVGADAPWASPLSVPTAIGMLTRALTGQTPYKRVDGVIHTCRTLGEVVAVLVIAALWVVAVRRARGAGGNPMGLFAGAMAAAVLLAPAVQPWYYLWAIVPAALIVRRHPSVIGLVTAGLVFPFVITPSGAGWESDLRFPLVLAATLGLVVAALGRRPSQPATAPTGSTPATAPTV